jgi:hypothetical protein
MLSPDFYINDVVIKLIIESFKKVKTPKAMNINQVMHLKGYSGKLMTKY